MNPAFSHSWTLSPREAMELQRELAGRAVWRADFGFHGGLSVLACDVSYSKATDLCFGAAVLGGYRDGSIIEEAVAIAKSPFPYVPGLLSFRELPVLVRAIGALRATPDFILAEGHGRAHPRRFGLATHLGVLFDRPAIGCAKSRLVGRHRAPADRRGAAASLMHEDEKVGIALRTRAGVKPVYVSQGHRLSLEQCAKAVLQLTPRFRMPDLLRRAHFIANEVRRAKEAAMGVDGG